MEVSTLESNSFRENLILVHIGQIQTKIELVDLVTNFRLLAQSKRMAAQGPLRSLRPAACV